MSKLRTAQLLARQRQAFLPTSPATQWLDTAPPLDALPTSPPPRRVVDWPTVRSYPRTAADAFRDAEYACAVQRQRERTDSLWDYLLIALLIVFVVAVLVGWLP